MAAMKPAEWVNFIWYGLLILTFIIGVAWAIQSSRKHKGRFRAWLRKVGNWFVIVFSRIGSDLRLLFMSPTKRRMLELQEQKRAEEYKKRALMRFICPRCEHRLLCIPVVPPADPLKGTKFYCINCGYERIDRDEE